MLAVEVAKLPKLCNLNVLRNESMGKAGAMALAKCLADGGCDGALRSLCGIGVGAAANSLEVPRKELEPIDALIFAAELMNTQWSESLGNEQNQGRKMARLMRKGRVDGSAKWYPLIWAARDGNNALVEALIESGVPVDQAEQHKNDAGFTPLMCATIKGHAKTVELLLERGADTELMDNHKKTAAMHAEARGFKAIKALIDYCAEQSRANKRSFTNVIARAAFIKTAVTNFKASLGTVNPSIEADKADGREQDDRRRARRQCAPRGMATVRVTFVALPRPPPSSLLLLPPPFPVPPLLLLLGTHHPSPPLWRAAVAGAQGGLRNRQDGRGDGRWRSVQGAVARDACPADGQILVQAQVVRDPGRYHGEERAQAAGGAAHCGRGGRGGRHR